MPTWAWVSVIAIVLLVVAALVAGRVRAGRQRTRELRARFGPEYDRAVKAHGRRKAEAELAAREQRRQTLEIVPLEREARERYATQWEEVQAQFVDSPVVAVSAAHALVTGVMAERGYPMTAFEQRAADVSVDHPHIVENYRHAHEIFRRTDDGEASTEDLRQAMQHYRTLFGELLAADGSDNGPDKAEASASTDVSRR